MCIAHVGNGAAYVGFYKLHAQLLYKSKTILWGPMKLSKYR